MVTGCGCLDPVVFGHGPRCKSGLGPSVSGGTGDNEWHPLGSHIQTYDPTVPPERPMHHMTARRNARIAAANNALELLRRKLSGE